MSIAKHLGGGYLVEMGVPGCVAQIGCLFGLSGLPIVYFFYLKTGLDIGSIFAKYFFFSYEFFLQFTYRLSKSTYAPHFTW